MNLLKASENYSGFGDSLDSGLSLHRSKSAIINASNKAHFLKSKPRKRNRRGKINHPHKSNKHLDFS